MLRTIATVILGAVFLASVNGATAQDFGISEFRAGLLAHSVDEPGPGGEPVNLSRWQDVTFELLFTSPEIDAFRWLGSPKPNLGVTVNTGGLESMVHLGLTWQAQLFDTAFFVEGTFGAALHNGASNGATFPARNLGCALHFYEGAGIGMNVSDNMNVILAWEHASSANLCSPNRGLTNVGIKIGYSF